jgi:hypothetical protein
LSGEDHFGDAAVGKRNMTVDIPEIISENASRVHLA